MRPSPPGRFLLDWGQPKGQRLVQERAGGDSGPRRPQSDGAGGSVPAEPPKSPTPCTGVSTQVLGSGESVTGQDQTWAPAGPDNHPGTSTPDLLWMGHDALCPLRCSPSPQTASPRHPPGLGASLTLSPAHTCRAPAAAGLVWVQGAGCLPPLSVAPGPVSGSLGCLRVTPHSRVSTNL